MKKIYNNVAAVLEQGNQVLEGTNFGVVCVEHDFSVQPCMAAPIMEHFSLGTPENQYRKR